MSKVLDSTTLSKIEINDEEFDVKIVLINKFDDRPQPTIRISVMDKDEHKIMDIPASRIHETQALLARISNMVELVSKSAYYLAPGYSGVSQCPGVSQRPVSAVAPAPTMFNNL
jgi:hypothetical protein